MKIDDIDVQILKILLKDGRASFSSIAKKCKMSTNAIRMRYNNLKEKGVITGSITQIDLRAIGYEYIAIISIQTDFNEKNDFFEDLLNIPNNIGYDILVSKYNIAAFFALKKVDEVDEILYRINKHPNVKQTFLTLGTTEVGSDYPTNLNIEPCEIWDFPKKEAERQIIKCQNIKPEQIDRELNTNIMDKTDILILNEMANNARTSFNKIGTKTGISTQTAIDRYEKLKAKKVIFNSSITLDLSKLGYIGRATFIIETANNNQAPDILCKLQKIPDAIMAMKFVGSPKILVIIVFKSIHQLINTHQEISRTSNIITVEFGIQEIFPSWPFENFSRLISD
ncbi:MAG: AsnC family transcriptional regulator [Candidatus Bathyarchaeota archaeon]|nr:AsnC family transcriptional regulator [Candidatus Bathyarchaeum sp.]